MSENITHIASLDDIYHLMRFSDDICEPMKQSGLTHWRFSHFGSITRSGDAFTAQLLAKYRSAWADRKPEDKIEQKLAFVMGWLCHRAADREMKPVFHELDPKDKRKTPGLSDVSIYNDAFIFKQYYAGRNHPEVKEALFERGMESLQAANFTDVEATKELFRVILQNNLMEIHTFIPDKGDIEGWLDRLFVLQQKFTVDLERYAKAVNDPDPDLWHRYIVEVNFYQADEPLLALVNRIRQGGTATAEEVRDAIAQDTQSHYARILQTGYKYLVVASRFFTGAMPESELMEQLDVGKLGKNGMVV